MTVASLFTFEQTYARDLEGLYVTWSGAAAPDPELLVLNADLADELGLDPEALREGLPGLAPEGIAMAYAGHQFGGYSPRLGDGRALLLGEVVDTHGRRRDLHLKGSGRTPFARGGDGKAAVGPMLREYVISEAMHALGIPTTRALAVVATGEPVRRETLLPGAVLTRVAASHIRVGTFEYAARNGGDALVRRLADYAIERHYPGASYVEFYEAVVEAQAQLIARWMLVGFIHGVMNTDNMAISGETIDYGPCAFMDLYDSGTVYSSIDHMGRYAYGNQAHIAQWNLARLAETLVPLLAPDTKAAVDSATEILQSFPDRFGGHWREGMRAKLGLAEADLGFFEDTLGMLQQHHIDYTTFFRDPAGARDHFLDGAAYDAWAERWHPVEPTDRVNPLYIPRNHLVEEALAAATAGDLEPVRELLDVLAQPFDERPGYERYAEPAPDGFGPYRTFCGT